MLLRTNSHQYHTFNWFRSGISFITVALLMAGCSNLSALKPTYYLPIADHAKEVNAPNHLSRLIVIRPRESLMPFNESNPVQIYAGSKKLGEVHQGRFVIFEGQTLPNHMTIHWFDPRQPTISKTIPLHLNIHPDQALTVRLKMVRDKLVLETLTPTMAASVLPWLADGSRISLDEDHAVASSFDM